MFLRGLVGNYQPLFYLNMWYSINNENYTFKIKKLTDEQGDLEVWFTKKLSCGEDKIKLKETKSPSGELTIIVPEKSFGLFELHIKSGRFEDTKIVPYFPTILKSIIEDLEKLFCKCNCEDCEDCVSREDLLNVLFKTTLYYSLSGNYYSKIFSEIVSCVGCDLDKEMLCVLSSENFYGNYKVNLKFLKKLLAIYYLSFYITDNNKETKINVYNYNKIKRCLSSLNISNECIKKSTGVDLDNPTVPNVNTKDNIYNRTLDNVLYTENRVAAVITSNYFLDGYYDSENREIKKVVIKNITLDRDGTSVDRLVYNDVDVVEGQEIPFQDIIDNKLKYIPRNVDKSTNSYFMWDFIY